MIGHGLNALEQEANKRLDRHWLQNLNHDQHLPLKSGSVGAAMIVAGWHYLQQPEEVAAELLRVLRPGGRLIVAISNRRLFQKAPGSGPMAATGITSTFWPSMQLGN